MDTIGGGRAAIADPQIAGRGIDLPLSEDLLALLSRPCAPEKMWRLTETDLQVTARELAALGRAVDCALASVLAEQVDRDSVSTPAAMRAASHDLMSHTGDSDIEARATVAMAVEMGQVPEVFTAYGRAEIGFSAARRIAGFIIRHAGELSADARAECIRVLLKTARSGRARELGRALAMLDEVLADDDIPADEDVDRNRLHLSKTFQGRYRLDADLDGTTGGALRRVLDLFNAQVPRPDGSSDPRGSDERDGGAMAELFRRLSEQIPLIHPDDPAPEHPADPAAGPSRSRRTGGVIPGTHAMFVFTFADAISPRPTAALRSSLLDRGAFTEYLAATTVGRFPGHTPVRWATMRRLACDCLRSVTITDAAGAPLTVDTGTRLATRAQRMALQVRDHGCAFPRCDRPVSWTQAHHIRHWIDGGPTSLDNLVLLCTAHHRDVHAGWEVAMAADRLPVFRPPASQDPQRGWLGSDGQVRPGLDESTLIFRDTDRPETPPEVPSPTGWVAVRQKLRDDILQRLLGVPYADPRQDRRPMRHLMVRHLTIRGPDTESPPPGPFELVDM